MSENKTVTKGDVIAAANSHHPVLASDHIQRTFRPHGSGQVPTSVPPLPSGVAPSTPPTPPVQPQPTTSQNGNKVGSKSGN